MAGEVDGYVTTFELAFFTDAGLDFQSLPAGATRNTTDRTKLPTADVTYVSTTAVAAGDEHVDSADRGIRALLEIDLWMRLSNPADESPWTSHFGRADGDLHLALWLLTDSEWWESNTGGNPLPAEPVLGLWQEPEVSVEPEREGNVMHVQVSVGVTLKET